MKVLTFGEIMLRLKDPGAERLFQTPVLEATFGGGEANVAVSLANYGMDVQFLTVLPNNPVGTACLAELRRFGVDTKKILFAPGAWASITWKPEPTNCLARWSTIGTAPASHWQHLIVSTGTVHSRVSTGFIFPASHLLSPGQQWN